jgi:pyridoxamine 5'-phosphate oxidase
MTFYNDLNLSFAEAQQIIEKGATDRRSAAHSPVVATIDSNGAPSQRVMILRDVNWNSRTLRFHTDRRSAKAREVREAEAASVLIYMAETKIQLRLTGTAALAVKGSEFDAAWDASTNFARRCYMAETKPGAVSHQPTSGLPTAIEGTQPTLEAIAPAKENFALFLFQFSSLEWLYLANSGHRRARWTWHNAEHCWNGNWLVP